MKSFLSKVFKREVKFPEEEMRVRKCSLVLYLLIHCLCERYNHIFFCAFLRNHYLGFLRVYF